MTVDPGQDRVNMPPISGDELAELNAASQGPVGAQFQLFDELEHDEYEALKADIAKRGVLVPIEYDEAGNILDGHHRKQIVDELGIKDYPTVVRRFCSEEEKTEHVVTLNVRRRHLNRDQKRRWAEWFLRRHPEWSNRRVASEIGLTDPTVAKVRENLEADGELLNFSSRVSKDGRKRPSTQPKPTTTPSIFTPASQAQRAQAALSTLGDEAPSRQLDLKRTERAAREKTTEQQRATADTTPLSTPDITILHTAIDDLDLEADTVDLIFTDPPYPAEYLPTWSSLAALASHVLKPGGLLVAYTGQMFLPDVMHRLSEHGLDYWWCYAVTHVGSFFQLRDRRTQVGWKPLLVYRKPGNDRPPWTNDIVTEGTREKSGHDWQQSEAEAVYWIGKLTEPGDLVVDPFLGSGTTAAVCKTLGRRFVGCDIDPLAVQRTKDRLT